MLVCGGVDRKRLHEIAARAGLVFVCVALTACYTADNHDGGHPELDVLPPPANPNASQAPPPSDAGARVPTDSAPPPPRGAPPGDDDAGSVNPGVVPNDSGCVDRTLGVSVPGTEGYSVHNVLVSVGMLRGVRIRAVDESGGDTEWLGTIEIWVSDWTPVTEHAEVVAGDCERELDVDAQVRVFAEDGFLQEAPTVRLAIREPKRLDISVPLMFDQLKGSLTSDPRFSAMRLTSVVLTAALTEEAVDGRLVSAEDADTPLVTWRGVERGCYRPYAAFTDDDTIDCGEHGVNSYTPSGEPVSFAPVKTCVDEAMAAGASYAMRLSVSGKGISRTSYVRLREALTRNGMPFLQTQQSEAIDASMRRCTSLVIKDECNLDTSPCVECVDPGEELPLCLDNGRLRDSWSHVFPSLY